MEKCIDQVVVFVVKGHQVLLWKRTRKFGKGCWNGPGGKFEPGEKPAEAAVREFKAESGGAEIEADSLVRSGIIAIKWRGLFGHGLVIKLHVFTTDTFTGVIGESNELVDPDWFDIDRLPEPMMPGDKKWLYRILSGQKIVASLEFEPFNKRSPRVVRMFEDVQI